MGRTELACLACLAYADTETEAAMKRGESESELECELEVEVLRNVVTDHRTCPQGLQKNRRSTCPSYRYHPLVMYV